MKCYDRIVIRSCGARAPDFLSSEEWSRVVCALGLTKREGEVVRAACYDDSQRAIAERLDIAEYTVHTHWHNVFAKLGVHSVASAILVFIAAELELRAGRLESERPLLSATGSALGDTSSRRAARSMSSVTMMSESRELNGKQREERKAVVGER